MDALETLVGGRFGDVGGVRKKRPLDALREKSRFVSLP